MTRFRFGTGWFDTETRELKFDRRDLEALKPKHAEVLELLIRNRHRVMTRDAFFDHVWKDVTVSEQALNKVVTELRTVLGDDARDSTYIKTYSKKGYKWIYDDTVEEPLGEPNDHHLPVPRATRPARRRLALVFIAISAIAVSLWMIFGGQSKPAQVGERPVLLALAPFQNATGDPEKVWIEEGLRDIVLRTVLELADVETIDNHDLKNALEMTKIRMDARPEVDQVQQLGSVLKFDYLVFTTVKRSSDHYILEYVLWHGSAPSSSKAEYDSLLEAAEYMAYGLAVKLDSAAAGVGLGGQLSGDAFVNETYAKGVQFLEEGELPKAVNHFEVCLDHKPTMAWAKLQLATALRMQDESTHARRLFNDLLEQARTMRNPKLEADVLRNLGLVERRVGNWQEALTYTTQCYEIYQSLHYPQGELATSSQIATILARLGDLDAAERRLRDDYQVAASLGNKYLYYSTAIKMATILSMQGKIDEAESIYRDALRLVKQLNDRRNQASILENLGNIHLLRSDYGEARVCYQEALNINRDFYNKRGVAACIQNLGAIYLMQERFDDAHAYFVRALNLSREVGDRFLENQILYNLGEVRLNGGKFMDAESYLIEAQELARQQHNANLTVDTTLRLALLYAFEGRTNLADEQIQTVRLETERNPGFHFVMAYLAYQSGSWREALKHQSLAKELAGNDWSDIDQRRLDGFELAVVDGAGKPLEHPHNVPDF